MGRRDLLLRGHRRLDSPPIQVYDNGPILHYEPEHPADDHGQKEWRRMDADEDWRQWTITSREFEEAWLWNL